MQYNEPSVCVHQNLFISTQLIELAVIAMAHLQNIIRPYQFIMFTGCSGKQFTLLLSRTSNKPNDPNFRLNIICASPAKKIRTVYGSIVVTICGYRLNSKKFVNDDCT